jgi:CPA2 family monovalent cation:H+ antiporter-2
LGELMAGLGSPAPIEVGAGNHYVGKTLAEINLRGLTGATVLAIRRGHDSVLIPAGSDRLEVGDILAIAGTQESREAAQKLFRPEL